jgi:hypothetical protein
MDYQGGGGQSRGCFNCKFIHLTSYFKFAGQSGDFNPPSKAQVSKHLSHQFCAFNHLLLPQLLSNSTAAIDGLHGPADLR